MGTDVISVLSHGSSKLAKTWLADGTIKNYDDAKYYRHQTVTLSGIADLSRLLAKLQDKPRSCVVRGQYIGDDRSAKIDLEYQAGRVRRTLENFEDAPRHAIMVEVDTFEPLTADPVTDPQVAIDEYIQCCLPEAFHGASYHWQMSNSAGSAKNVGKLKAHIWFWLETPYRSDQLRAWANFENLDLDKSVLNPVQIHYTSAPVFEEGVTDPIPVRSGSVAGLLSDSVPLVLSDAAMAGVSSGPRISKKERIDAMIEADPRARVLRDKGMIKNIGKESQLFIQCPRESEHSGDSGETSTMYYMPNTGGFTEGRYVCLHAHCNGVHRSVFDEALGFDNIADDFSEVTAGDELLGESRTASGKDKVIRTVPKANYLTTDQANANRIAKHFRKQLLFCEGKWYGWTGKFWDCSSADAYMKALKLSDIIIREAHAYLAKDKVQKSPYVVDSKGKETKTTENEATAASLMKWAQRSEMKTTIDAALATATKLLEIDSVDLDAAPYVLNVANGTIDLRTGELRGHEPRDFITKMIDVVYNPETVSETFTDVLTKVCCEDHLPWKHRHVSNFLKRWFGYCATSDIREHKFVVHYGNGRNGKSTIIDAVTGVLADYSGVAAPGLLISSKNEKHPTEIASLMGKRMITVHETNEGGMLREDFIKQATGGDRLTARFMRGDFFEFTPTHKLQMLTNYKPSVRGQDAGIWGRVLLVPYQARFDTQEELDRGLATHLVDRTVAERLAKERSGILTWIVQGAIEWFSVGLLPPDSILAASSEYKSEQDRVGQFVSERCELSDDYECALSGDFDGLYPAYQGWCKDSGFQALSKNKLLQELERIIPKYKKSKALTSANEGSRKKQTLIKGIKLIEDT
ncbi:DNA primase family protein [Undibacterium sp. Di26W]|uniref:DNA primase family protein n=1 Tax=Undibacterium sp. Di26W TaxID=3413035 RepID=UPI003BF0C443